MSKHKIAILTDSCADLTPALCKKYDIRIIPLTISFSDGDYADGVDITPADVYRRQKTELPKTSLPSGERIEDAFQKIRADGYTKVIALCLSSGLSGTYNLVRMLGAQADGLEVSVFDTLSGSLGISMVATQIARWRGEGWSYEELCRAVPILQKNTHALFCVDTLEFLQKGGRIGTIAAVAGTLLQIKPILGFAEDGRLTSFSKARGQKAAMERMVQMLTAKVPRGVTFSIAAVHGDAPNEFRTLSALFQKALPDYTNWQEGEIDCTLASHVGPHLLGIAVQIIDPSLCREK